MTRMKSCTRLQRKLTKFSNWGLLNTLRSKSRLNTSIGFKKISGAIHGLRTGSVSTRPVQSESHGKISANSSVNTSSPSWLIGWSVQYFLGLLLPILVVRIRLKLEASLSFLFKDGYTTSQRLILVILHAELSATTLAGLVSHLATSLLAQPPPPLITNPNLIDGTTGLTWSHMQPCVNNQKMLLTPPW